jgi:hypothetical protein
MIRKFDRGEVLTAARLNELIDEVLRGKLIACDDSIQLTRGPFGTTISVNRKPLGIVYRNDYAGDVTPYGIVAVKSIDVTNPGLPMAVTDRPSSTFRQINLVNNDWTIGEDKYGLAQLGPVVTFAYETGSPALGEGFGPKPSQFPAAENYPGILTCIGIVDATEKWALGTWNPLIQEVFGQTQGAIAKNATNGTVEVYSGAPGSGASIITSMTITGVHNPWEDVADNKKVLVRWVNGLPTLVGKEC